MIRGTGCIAKFDIVNLVESLEPLVDISAGVSIELGKRFRIFAGEHGTKLTRFGRNIIDWLQTRERTMCYDMIIPPFNGDLTIGVGS